MLYRSWILEKREEHIVRNFYEYWREGGGKREGGGLARWSFHLLVGVVVRW
jgi:hypothetical protein